MPLFSIFHVDPTQKSIACELTLRAAALLAGLTCSQMVNACQLNPNGPGSTTHFQYVCTVHSGEEGFRGCYEFFKSVGYANPYCHTGGLNVSVVGAGWYFVNGIAYLADFFVCAKGSIYVDKPGGGSCIPVVDVDLPPPVQQCGANPPQGQPIFPTPGTKRQFVKSSLSLAWLDHSFAYDSASVIRGDAYTTAGIPIRSGDLGPLWFSSFHNRLDFNGNSTAVKVLRGNGAVKVFASSGGNWVPSQDNADSLTVSGSSYLYRDQSALTLEVYDNGTAVQ